MNVRKDAILYRAHRLRFAFGAPFAIALTVGIVALEYDGIFLGDKGVRGVWLMPPLNALLLWFDYIILGKLVWPPELEISTCGIRWKNRSMMANGVSYGWQEFEGPEEKSSDYGIPLLQIVLKKTGKKLLLPPSHFGATYDEMAAIIAAAKNGNLISPQEWRAENPSHPFKAWILEWGLPIAGGIFIAMFLRGDLVGH